jgi:hypothetical protein
VKARSESSDRRKHPPTHWHVAGHMLSAAGAFFPVLLVALGVGMAIYHWVEGRPWPDSFLSAAMLLSGMGPVDDICTTTGKWLVGLYALVAGLAFIVLAGVMLSPVIHHLLVRLDLDAEE